MIAESIGQFKEKVTDFGLTANFYEVSDLNLQVIRMLGCKLKKELLMMCALVKPDRWLVHQIEIRKC